MVEKSLNHFLLARFHAPFWQLPSAQRGAFFTRLESNLWSSEARRYTERDTPNFTAIWRSSQDLGNLYAGEQE